MRSKKLISVIIALFMTICSVQIVSFAEEGNFSITVPGYAMLKLEEKNYSGYNYMPFDEVQSLDNIESTYSFNLTENKEYYYRVYGDDFITYAGYFTYDGLNSELVITDDMLSNKAKNTVDKDLYANDGHNVADIFLNINAKGYLILGSVGDTYQLINLRTWQAVDNTTKNVFIEPDYHYEVIDEDGSASDSVIAISDDGLITAVGDGTAIVLVTYDAMDYAKEGETEFFGAIWPENTGVFVVSVGAGETDTNLTLNDGRNNKDTSAGKLSGDALDSELDVIYFDGKKGEYVYTPNADCEVYVANPSVSKKMSFYGFSEVLPNKDGEYAIPLLNGRNIVRVEQGGAVDYQVITAKKISIDTPKSAKTGDEISISFDKIYHPANKLAGIYNMAACITYIAPDGKMVGGSSTQYGFANSVEAQTVNSIIEKQTVDWMTNYTPIDNLKIPENWEEDTYTLTGGTISVLGYGDPFGNHRGITLENGKAPNLNADMKEAFLGKLPDITITVQKKQETKKSSGGGGTSVKGVSINIPVETVKTETVKTESFGLQGKNPDIKQMPVLEKGKTFDDIKEHSYKKEIEELASRKIVLGKTENSFDPDITMTRAEFATIVTRALGLAEVKEKRFDDVLETDWYFGFVGTSYKYGIIKGISETEFNPNGLITKEQASLMLLRAEKLCGIITDADESTVIASKELIKRGEMAGLIYDMLNRAKLLGE